MAVNYGLLQNIQPPSVVGQLPGSQQSSGDSLASGIMGGLQQGMNIRSMKQNMDQNAALFPSQLLRSQQAAESEGIDLQDKKQAQKDRKDLRAASAESETKYLDALAKLNPAEAQDYMLKKAQTAKATAEVAGVLEDNKSKGLDNYAKAITLQGQVAGSSLAGADDEMKQRLYSYGRSNAPKALQDIMPEKFDQKWAIGAIKLAEENMADYLEKEGQKNLSSNQKDDRREVLLTNKVKNGTASEDDKLELSRIQERQGSRARGAQTSLSPSQQINVQTTVDRLKETGKTATLATQNLSTLGQMEKLNSAAFSGRGADVELKAKQFLEFVGLPPKKGTSATEAFNAVAKNSQLVAQTLLKGSSSDRDMTIVAETNPQVFNTEQGRVLMISAAKYKAMMDQQYHAFLNAFQNKNNGSLDGADEAWNNFVQSRNDFDSKTLKFNSEGIKKKSWEAFLDPEYTAPVSEKTADTNVTKTWTYNPQTGKLE
jgi:hypothetical protein